MKHVSPKFVLSALAAAALAAGCEWTGTSESGSWSGNYSAMNFSGTYRATSVETSSSSTSTDTSDEKKFSTTTQSGGSFAGGTTAAAGTLSHGNIVPGSVQISVGGKYIWTDNGSGNLVLGGGSSSGTAASTTTQRVINESQGSFETKKAVWSGTLTQKDIVAGSVQIKAGSYTWMDNGSGGLVCAAAGAQGSILYTSGAWSVDITNLQKAYQQLGSSVPVTSTYSFTATSGTTIEGVSGSGTILYSSGSWSISISPKMPSSQSISISYSYYDANSSSSGGSSGAGWTSGTAVTSATVSQNGQNLTITLNNGIVMTGKFTGVVQTGKIDEDTGKGANTYNAQFQVASGKESKMVGTLSYDYPSHNRMLDATWTWGKSTYDIHGTGPAWTESGTTTDSTAAAADTSK